MIYDAIRQVMIVRWFHVFFKLHQARELNGQSRTMYVHIGATACCDHCSEPRIYLHDNILRER